MSTEKRQTFTVSLDEMRQHFERRIICGRCGNGDWTKFTYQLPRDGRVLVQCTQCYLMEFKSMEPNQNESTQK
jgi:hypothetical protein